MKSFLPAAIEKALNAYLHADDLSVKRLARMSGKSISIELMPSSISFNCHFHHDKVTVDLKNDFTPVTKIKGTPLQLLSAFIDKERRHQFFADDVSIEGDAEFAQQVINLFDQIHIDVEEHASRYIGDTSAHQLGRLIKGIRKWVTNTGQSFSQDVNDYLHEEAAWFPVKEELRDFFEDIDTIRMDTDRLEARLKRIKAQLNDEESL
ncbi:MAG TPA: SCP2 sterol-binding domain-containing protein [Gammaproteobacteria bacterium]|jgi:ubiquinone biosynthesis protein UbiJ|nr:SCP2 sterol-binding domain-containing protein [Gammaproteobacteria bacterium]